jgi:hypothetical protein
LQGATGKRCGKIAINPDRFDKLITALRTAVDNDGTLDKEAASHNDIFATRTAPAKETPGFGFKQR